MRNALLFGSSALVLTIFAAAACSDSSSGDPTTPMEAGPRSDAPVSPGEAGSDSAPGTDAGDDAGEPLTTATEVEPNNATPEIGSMKLPGVMNGKIDPVADVDVFAVDLVPGEFWEWSAAPTGADLAPHLTVFDSAKNSMNPIVVGYAAAGKPALLQHFVLRSGTFLMVMRDARNVPAPGTKGGPTYGYAVTGKRGTPKPVAVTFPSTKAGKLAGVGAEDFYVFTSTAGKGFDVVVNADRKNPRSTLDSRLSIFDLTKKSAIGTNDNAAGTTDSQLGSPDPLSGSFLVIVDNEGKDESDLSYEIEFKQRP